MKRKIKNRIYNERCFKAAIFILIILLFISFFLHNPFVETVLANFYLS